jgi:hypothetical protein
MRPIVTCLLFILYCVQATAQSDSTEITEPKKYFIGIAFGVSIAVGNFGDTDVNNADAGFAQGGRRYDLYGGFLLSDRVTLTAGVRYQNFATEVSDVVSFFNDINSGITFSGENGDWQTYYLLAGAAYKVPIGKKFALYPRFSLGPLWVESPGLDVQATEGVSQNNFSRSSETGFGLGYDLGVGLRTDLGNRLSLLPTFTFSGGSVDIEEVETRFNNVTSTRTFEARIQSFNLGLSLALRL